MPEHDPSIIYSKLADLYQEARRVHEASGDALVEIINALSRKADADAAFLSAFRHLVPQPVAAHDRQSDNQSGHQIDHGAPRATPPPVPRQFVGVPPPGAMEDDDGRAFEQRLDHYRQRFGGGV
jgi:hypothetical protein